MLSKTEIDQKFSAAKEHGEEVAAKFKEFVQHLDSVLPDGVSKKQLVSALETASSWAHNALEQAETTAKNALHQVAKSGEKPASAPSSSDAPPVVPVTPTA